MALEQKITVDASGVLTGVNTLNSTIASIGDSLNTLNGNLGKTRQAFDSLESKLTSTLRSARDAAISLSKAANDATSSVQKAVSGLASIDSALEKRVAKVRSLRAELQQLAGTSLAGGGGASGGGGGGGGRGGAGGGPDAEGVARLGDFTRFNDQLIRQFAIIGQSRAFFFLKDQIGEAVATAKELDGRIAEIQTISQQAGRSTAAWTAELVKLSTELGKPVIEVADALYQTLSNNIRGAQGNTEEFLRSVGNFARVTRTSFPGAVDAISSALNSYGLSIDKAEGIQAKLFKGIELGRFRGEELATALGKNAPIASQLGVSIDELVAQFVVLTDQGQNLNTASTLTLNLLSALLKPSKELATFYQNQGVSSGQEFIQVNGGIANILNVLADRSKGATKEITELVKNLRGGRAAIGITSDIERFNSALGEIKDSKRSFQLAVEIEKGSSSRAIDEFIARLKAQTITSVGAALVSAFAGAAKLDSATGLFTGEFGALAIGESAIAVAGATKLFDIISKTTVVQNAFLNTAIQTSRVMPIIGDGVTLIGTKLALAVGSLTAGFIIGQKIFGQSQSQLRTVEAINKLLKDRQELQVRATTDTQAEDFERNTEAVFNKIQRGAAASRATISREFEQARVSVRTSFESLSSDLTNAFSRARSAVQDLDRDISRNKNSIDNANKSLGDFKATAEKSFINLKIDLADPNQKLKLFDNEIDRLKNKGSNLVIRAGNTRGTQGEEFLREGQSDLAEALSLAKQRVAVLQEIARNNGQQLSSTTILNQLEQDSLRVINAKVAAVREFTRLKEIENQKLEQEKQAEKLRLTQLESTVKLFSEIQTKIGDGSIAQDKNFQQNGIFNPELVKNRVAVLGAIIQQGLFKIDPAAATKFSLDLADTITKSTNAVNAIIKERQATQDAEALIQLRSAAKDRANAISEISATLTNSLSKAEAGGIADAAQKLTDLSKVIGDKTIFNRTLPIQETADLSNNLRDVRDLLTDIRKIQPDQNGILNIPPEQLQRLQAAQIALERLKLTDKGRSPELAPVVDLINAEIQRTTDQSLRLQKLVEDNGVAQTRLLDLSQSGADAFQDKLHSLASATDEGTESVKRALASLANAINAAIPNIGNSQPVQNRSHGGIISALQGMDTQLAGLRPGEIVMNPRAARAFAAQLQSMNNMSSIPYGQGGNVSVGDVNVYVSGANTAEQNVLEIGHGIRRQMRRGNLRF